MDEFREFQPNSQPWAEALDSLGSIVGQTHLSREANIVDNGQRMNCRAGPMNTAEVDAY